MTIPRTPMAAAALAMAATFMITGPESSPVGESAVRPSLDLWVELPPTPVVVEGRLRLLYELHLSNLTEEALVLSRVEVLDRPVPAGPPVLGEAAPKAAAVGHLIGEFRGETLARRLSAPTHSGPEAGSGAETGRLIAPGTSGVVYIELALEGEAPRALEHRIAYHGEGGDADSSVMVSGAAVEVRPPAPLVLGAPLRGGAWAAIHHPCWARGHRRVFYEVHGRARIPGRFAIDWMKMDDNGRLAAGDRDLVANWYGYGADVLAVADGVVATTRDGLQESATLSGRTSPPPDESEGNRIVLDLEDGRFVFYGHLAPGSIRVRPGDRVWRGQVIGAVGFSGSAAGPQLHLHVGDAVSSLAGEGLPFELEAFKLLGHLGPEEGSDPCEGATRVLESLGESPWIAAAESPVRDRMGEFPAPSAVIHFGAGDPHR